jgi:hypothetical protein
MKAFLGDEGQKGNFLTRFGDFQGKNDRDFWHTSSNSNSTFKGTDQRALEG